MKRVQFMEPSALLSDRARKAFQLANQEAQRLNHPAPGLEHLLLGLAKETIGPAAQALKQFGFDLAWLRGKLQRRLRCSRSEHPLPGKLPYTVELQDFLNDAVDAGRSCDMLPLTPEHLLVSLMEEPDGPVMEVLSERRLALWRLRRRLRRLIPGPVS